MTKEELSQIYYLNKEIKIWQKELERLECQSLLKGHQLTGMPTGGGSSDKVGDLAVKKVDIQLIIEGKLAEIQRLIMKLDVELKEIPFPECEIIKMRAINNMSWRQIGYELGVDKKTARSKYEKYIQIFDNSPLKC